MVVRSAAAQEVKRKTLRQARQDRSDRVCADSFLYSKLTGAKDLCRIVKLLLRECHKGRARDLAC